MSIRRAALLVLVVAGCRGDGIEYHRVEFPGFSLEVPTILTYGKDQVTQYRAGRVEARDGSRLVMLTWRAGAISTVEDMPEVMRIISGADSRMTIQAEPARALQLGGQDATQIEGDPRFSIQFSTPSGQGAVFIDSPGYPCNINTVDWKTCYFYYSKSFAPDTMIRVSLVDSDNTTADTVANKLDIDSIQIVRGRSLF